MGRKNVVHVMRAVLILLGVAFFSSSAMGQRKKDPDSSAFILQPDRIEFTIDKYDDDFTVINGGEDGLLVVKETSVRSNGGYGWALYKLDTALQEQWTKLKVIPLSYVFRGYDYLSLIHI